MPYWVRGFDTYKEEHQKYPKDITLRKQIIKDWYITRIIASIEKCVADKSRMLSDTTTKIYREREYNTDNVVLDNLPLETPFYESGWLSDTRLRECIYYSSSIPYIYHILHLEFIEIYHQDGEPLSFLQVIYPAKMPTEDYFPFVEFDIGTKMPLVLTEKERQEYYYYLGIRIEDTDWCYCIIWIDKHRMFISLGDTFYYFKQIGKNVHVFDLSFE